MLRWIDVAFPALAIALLSACGEPRVQVHAFPGPPEASMTDDALSLRAGTAWAIAAEPEDQSDKPVSAEASGALQVLPTGEKNLFVVVGTAPGEGSLTLNVGGRRAKIIRATVVSPAGGASAAPSLFSEK